MLAEHCILQAGLNPASKPAPEPPTAQQLDCLLQQIRVLECWLADCQDAAPKGYILLKAKRGPGAPAKADVKPGARTLV